MVPRVTIADCPPRLEWREHDGGREALGGEALLRAALRVQGAAALREFAVAAGPLGLCRHGLPCGCHPSCAYLGGAEAREAFGADPVTWGGWTGDPASGWEAVAAERRARLALAALLPPGEREEAARAIDEAAQAELRAYARDWRPRYWEPLAPWPFWLGRIQALVRLGQRLARGRQGPAADWARLLAPVPAAPLAVLCQPQAWEVALSPAAERAALSPVPEQRALLAERVTALVTEAGVLPRLDWVGEGPRLSLAHGRGWDRPEFIPALGIVPARPVTATLWGTLLVAAVDALLGAGGARLCGGCGLPLPARPGPGRPRAYCLACRAERSKAQKRAWKRAHSARTADAP